MGREPEGEENEIRFLPVTVWGSWGAIKKFAGENPELAKYYPEDDGFILEKEKYVQHYEIFYMQDITPINH